jgi:hypothetical protein
MRQRARGEAARSLWSFSHNEEVRHEHKGQRFDVCNAALCIYGKFAYVEHHVQCAQATRDAERALSRYLMDLRSRSAMDDHGARSKRFDRDFAEVIGGNGDVDVVSNVVFFATPGLVF